MFTGIIEELGVVKRISKQGNITRLEVQAEQVTQETKLGDSIPVNGACLTVVKNDPHTLVFEAMPETLKVSNLGALHPADKVNLERALKVGERVSGHFVSGHIDCRGVIREKRMLQGNLSFQIAFPIVFAKFCIPKGSIAVDGISLTIVEKRADSFSVYIIPHTLENTTLNFKGPSDKVNLEFDLLAKRINPA